jgi:hypothetical protein
MVVIVVVWMVMGVRDAYPPDVFYPIIVRREKEPTRGSAADRGVRPISANLRIETNLPVPVLLGHGERC